MILVIDNYDSFTYNLVQYLGELGEDLKVYRNDKITLEQIKKMNPEKIVISPGPGRPEDAGISVSIIKELSGKIPILGVCLGHQAIGFAYGGKIIQAKELMHGKTSQIYHDKKGIFKSIDNPFEATRYHSLVIEKKSLHIFFVVQFFIIHPLAFFLYSLIASEKSNDAQFIMETAYTFPISGLFFVIFGFIVDMLKNRVKI